MHCHNFRQWGADGVIDNTLDNNDERPSTSKGTRLQKKLQSQILAVSDYEAFDYVFLGNFQKKLSIKTLMQENKLVAMAKK